MNSYQTNTTPDYHKCAIAHFSFIYCAGGKIKKNEMGGACGAYGGGERCAQGSGGETGGKETIGETQT